MTNAALLEVTDLSVEFGRRGRINRVIQDVSFSVNAGETVALVGESGSGKTTIGRAILGLVAPCEGNISFDGAQILGLSTKKRRQIAAELQVVFQNPYGSLNPSIPIGRTLTEPMRVQRHVNREEADRRVADLLRKVGLPSDANRRYPAQFSGGQRQRIAIARAISVQPKLIICDEPTSSLDVSTQATVLELLKDLQKEFGIGFLFITHDLAVVRNFADRVLVLHDGEIVEEGGAIQVCDAPVHPYTRALIAAAPVPDPVLQRKRREEMRKANSEISAKSD